MDTFIARDVPGSSSKRYSVSGWRCHSLVSDMRNRRQIILPANAPHNRRMEDLRQFIRHGLGPSSMDSWPPTRKNRPSTSQQTSTPQPPSSPVLMSSSLSTTHAVSGAYIRSVCCTIPHHPHRRKIDWHIMPLMCSTYYPSPPRPSLMPPPQSCTCTFSPSLPLHLAHSPKGSPSWTKQPSGRPPSSASSGSRVSAPATLTHPLPGKALT